MGYNLLLAICSGAEDSCCVYIERGTDIICNFRGSLSIINYLWHVKEYTTRRMKTRTVAVKHSTLSA